MGFGLNQGLGLGNKHLYQMNGLLVSPSPFLTQGFRHPGLVSELIVAQENPKPGCSCFCLLTVVGLTGVSIFLFVCLHMYTPLNLYGDLGEFSLSGN